MWSDGEPFTIYRCANCTSTYCQWRNVTRHSVIIIGRIFLKALPGLTVAAQHLRAHHMELLPHMMYKTMLHRDCGQARYRTLYFCDHSLCIYSTSIYFYICRQSYYITVVKSSTFFVLSTSTCCGEVAQKNGLWKPQSSLRWNIFQPIRAGQHFEIIFVFLTLCMCRNLFSEERASVVKNKKHCFPTKALDQCMNAAQPECLRVKAPTFWLSAKKKKILCLELCAVQTRYIAFP